MVEAETERFTVGVFQDIAWAQKGIDALKQAVGSIDLGKLESMKEAGVKSE